MLCEDRAANIFQGLSVSGSTLVSKTKSVGSNPTVPVKIGYTDSRVY